MVLWRRDETPTWSGLPCKERHQGLHTHLQQDLRISAKPHNMTIIQVYAPISDYTDEEIEEFYEQLESVVAKVLKKEHWCKVTGM